MTRPLLALVCAALVVTGCGRLRDSRVNPFNWFGGSEMRATPAAEVARAEAADPRPLIGRVTALRVEERPGGAIVQATGLAPRQGYWNAELVSASGGQPVDGLLRYTFRVQPPPVAHPQGQPRTREVTVARYVGDRTLRASDRIVVVGARNQRVSRR